MIQMNSVVGSPAYHKEVASRVHDKLKTCDAENIRVGPADSELIWNKRAIFSNVSRFFALQERVQRQLPPGDYRITEPRAFELKFLSASGSIGTGETVKISEFIFKMDGRDVSTRVYTLTVRRDDRVEYSNVEVAGENGETQSELQKLYQTAAGRRRDYLERITSGPIEKLARALATPANQSIWTDNDNTVYTFEAAPLTLTLTESPGNVILGHLGLNYNASLKVQGNNEELAEVYFAGVAKRLGVSFTTDRGLNSTFTRHVDMTSAVKLHNMVSSVSPQ